MSQFQPIDQMSNFSDCKISKKFDSKGAFVDQFGKQVTSEYTGHQYQLITKKEREFTAPEVIGRVMLGVTAIVCSFGWLLFSDLGSLISSKQVLKLFTKRKETIHFGSPINGAAKPLLELDSRIQKFLQKPNRKQYSQLPTEFKYLIAGRFFYQDFGWSLRSKFSLIEEFERKIFEFDLPRAQLAIKEAVQLHFKIETLLKIKNNANNRDLKIQELDDLTSTQIKNCIKREVADKITKGKVNKGLKPIEDLDDFAMKVLLKDPYNSVVDEALNNLIIHLRGAYPANETTGYPFS